MILLGAFVLLLPLIVVRGGRPARLADVRFAGARYLVVGLGVQIAILETPLGQAPTRLLDGVHVVSYLLVAVFFWLNRRVPGFVFIGIGGGANFAAITSNGGVMPATAWATRVSGMADYHGHGFVNSAAGGRPLLWFLGDVFAIPASWPLANVFSVGDVLLVVGAAILLYRSTHTPSAAELAQEAIVRDLQRRPTPMATTAHRAA